MICHFLLLALLWQACCSLAPPTVRVCRNKHCSKKAPHLVESITDLLSPSLATVESCGCLSLCEKGPNAVVEFPRKAVLLHELNDATQVIVQLDLASNGDIVVPKLLGAAAKIMERVANTPDPVEHERLLDSVITKLAADESEHQRSSALARAHALRARARLDRKTYTKAIEDSQKVVLGDLRKVASDASLSLSYRVWADAEEKLGQQEQSSTGKDRKERVVAVLQRWQQAQPSYRTKLQREMQELLET